MANQQDQAVSTANAYFTAVQQIAALVDIVDALDNSYGQLNMSAILQQLPTCILSADGSLGTADSAPSQAAGHVIDTRVVSALKIAIASYDIGVAHDVCQVFSALWKGQAIAQQSAAPNVIAKTKTE